MEEHCVVVGTVEDVISLFGVDCNAGIGFDLKDVAYDPAFRVWCLVLDSRTFEVLALFIVGFLVMLVAPSLAVISSLIM
jgi:hypothetical protein